MPKFVRENPLGTLTLLGVVLYGLLRVCAVRFYSQFGVQPEEVGLSYAQLLAQSAAAYLALFLLLVLGIGALLLGLELLKLIATAVLRRAYSAAVRRKAPSEVIHRLAGWARDSEGAVKWVVMAGAWTASAYFLVAAASFWNQSRELAKDLQQGTSISGSFDITSWGSVLRLFKNPLGLRADRVTAIETGAPGSVLNLRSRTSLFYLGQASGTAVFYDSQEKETIRVPASGLLICHSQKRGACADR
jgi:hypothetical protein